jgi:galactokinase
MSAEQIQQAKQRFADVFGGTATAVVSAPGRVNLIGEHTDYNEGFVMPFCIDRYTVIAARPTGTAVCRVSSADGGVRNAITSFPGDSSLEPAPAGDWTNYMRGVVAGYLPKLPPGGCGFDAVVLSTVPLGGGLSSSAALEVATATLIETLYCLRVDPSEKALICQRCEHNFCGTPCGIMDQFISACGREGHALLIDCRPPFATEHVPLNNPKFTLVVANSNVKHSLSGSEYPERVQQCKDACAAMQAAGHTEVRAAPRCFFRTGPRSLFVVGSEHPERRCAKGLLPFLQPRLSFCSPRAGLNPSTFPFSAPRPAPLLSFSVWQVRFLRDATVAALESVSRSHGLSADVVRRARHAISEDQRTLQAKEALQAGDYEQVGGMRGGRDEWVVCGRGREACCRRGNTSRWPLLG